MKMIIRFFLIVALIIGGMILYFDQSRKFYCLSDDKCVTVWKRVGGICYLVPGKYYGLTKPTKSYVQTTNVNYAAVYWKEDLPNRLIVRLERDYRIINAGGEFSIEDFNLKRDENLKKNLYNQGSKKITDVNNGVNYISINIKEGYAMSKDGKMK